MLATIIAVAVFAFWVARDGFQAGGALGGLIIWAGLLAVLAAARRFGAR